jgi:hypothetical protein
MQDKRVQDPPPRGTSLCGSVLVFSSSYRGSPWFDHGRPLATRRSRCQPVPSSVHVAVVLSLAPIDVAREHHLPSPRPPGATHGAGNMLRAAVRDYEVAERWTRRPFRRAA